MKKSKLNTFDSYRKVLKNNKFLPLKIDKKLKPEIIHVKNLVDSLIFLVIELFWDRDFENASKVLTALTGKINQIPWLYFKVYFYFLDI